MRPVEDLLRTQRRRGFTLIELLVVIVILGILMAVALPTFIRQQTKAQDSRTQQYLTTAFKAIRASTPDTNNLYPSSTSMVSWIQQSEPELTTQNGNCLTGVTSAPVDAVLVDSGSTANSLQLCARSQSGNVWKLTATATGVQQLLDGTLVPLTMSGNEITDANRAANTQGDGFSNDSSTGVWEATTNLVTNGGFETNTTGWASGSGATVSRDTTAHKFGSASLKVTADGTTSGQGAYITFPVTSGTTYSVSIWVNGDQVAGKTIDLRTDLTSQADQSTTLGAGWQRLTITRTANATGTGDIFLRTGGTWAGTFWIDGVQLEQKAYATPYVETDGATAPRGAARVQASASLLNATQGWFAVRLRMGTSSAAISSTGLYGFAWQQSGNNNVAGGYYTGVWYTQREASGTGGGPDHISDTWSAGDTRTAIFAWTATQVGISVQGSAFTWSANTTIPTMTATLFDIGQQLGTSGWLDSSLLWAACGTGTLTNTDATTINSWGSNDPARSSFPASAQATMVWNGVGATGSLK